MSDNEMKDDSPAAMDETLLDNELAAISRRIDQIVKKIETTRAEAAMEMESEQTAREKP